MLAEDQNRSTLCFIHGWGFDSQVMTGLAAELQLRWNVRLIDMPGYGHNQPTHPPKGIDNIADSLISAVPADSILVGWSLGGMVAIKIAHSMRDKIKATVLLASTPCFVKRKDWPHGIEPALINDMAKRIPTDVDGVLQEFAGLTARGDIASKQTIRELKLLRLMNKTSSRALQDGLEILMNTDLRKELSELRCHVIMLLGDRDQLVASTSGNAAREIRPSIQLNYIQTTGHAPFISKKKETAEIINNNLHACTL